MTSVCNLTSSHTKINDNLVCLHIHAGKLLLEDLHTVYNGVIDARADWHELGLALGVTEPDLDNIGREKHANNERLREMLSLRLKLPTDLTWRKVIEALQGPTVRRDDVASKLLLHY